MTQDRMKWKNRLKFQMMSTSMTLMKEEILYKAMLTINRWKSNKRKMHKR